MRLKPVPGQNEGSGRFNRRQGGTGFTKTGRPKFLVGMEGCLFLRQTSIFQY